MGRPSDYTQDLADKICSELADGKSMRTVCSADEMPDKATVFRWIRTIEEFRNQYTRAKEESADALTDEMIDIADDGTNDYITKTNDDGSEYEALNSEHIQRSRLRIETRKWLSSKLKPKKYGDKQFIETKDTTDDISDEELNNKIQSLIKKNK
jgi:hypothetical protein